MNDLIIIEQTAEKYYGYTKGVNGLHFHEYGNITSGIYRATFYGSRKDCVSMFNSGCPAIKVKSVAKRIIAEKQLSDLAVLLKQIEDKNNSVKRTLNNN
jgi:hypothetical protein